MPLNRSPRPTVVSFSPIGPAEDQETLLEVADRVRRSVPDVVFVHHGPVADGAYWERIRALTRERLLEDTVRFMGPTERVVDAFNSADVTLSTSTGEGFPSKVIESLACGIPVVATAVGGIREALDGPGVTAPPGDAERLAEAVVAILRLPAGQRERLKEAARSTAVQKFALSTFADRYRASYRQLASLPVEPMPSPVEPIVVPNAEGEREWIHAMVSVTAFAGPVPPMPHPAGPMPRPAAPMLRPAAPMPRPAAPIWARPPESPRTPLPDDDAFDQVGALGRGTERSEAVQVVVSGLADDLPQVRRGAVRALMGIGGPVAGRALSDTLAHDPSPEVREEAAAALAVLLAQSSEAIEA